jgi:hypothetical protein
MKAPGDFKAGRGARKLRRALECLFGVGKKRGDLEAA